MCMGWFDTAHFRVLLGALFVFSLGTGFFFAPLIISLDTVYVFIIMAVVASLYGYFTGDYVAVLDDIRHDHHAAVWFAMILGSVLSAFILLYQATPFMQSMLPSYDTLVLFGLFFATWYVAAYTIAVLYHES